MPIATGNSVSAEQQLAFLRRISRILDEGKFTSTYKFAMLMALTNIAVTQGDDSGKSLEVDLDDVAREFVKLYWGMAKPYPSLGDEMLLQNREKKKPAKVITLVAAHSAKSHGKHTRHRAYAPSAASLISQTRQTIAKDVLYRLQNVRPTADGGTTKADRFIYDHPPDAASCATLKAITLKPGVAACMRSLRGVIAAMVQARWAQWVREHNPSLGADRGLEGFMFGADRAPVRAYAEWLYELQNGKCFYTGTKLGSPAAGEVDHFIPWSRYALDEPVNLVLASKRANANKSDHIAGSKHLQAWATRNAAWQLPEAFLANVTPGTPTANWNTARSIAAWMYEAAERDRVQAWEAIGKFGELDGQWRKHLDTG